MRFGEWLEHRLFRIDRERKDFSPDSMGNYYFVPSGSGRVDDLNNLPSWAKGGHMRRGMFAGQYGDVLSYLIPREIPYVIADEVPRKALYIRKGDIDSIRSYRPWISSFDRSSFSSTGKAGRGEYFSEKPGTPLKQVQVKKDPLGVLGRVYDLKIVDDVRRVRDDLVRRGVDHEAEGLPPE